MLLRPISTLCIDTTRGGASYRIHTEMHPHVCNTCWWHRQRHKAYCTYTRIHARARRPHVVRPNLFNPIKEPRRQSFERLLGRLKVTRVFVSSHLTHTGCVTGYETIRRTWRQWQASPIWKRSTRYIERRDLMRVEGQRFRVDYEESKEPIRRRTISVFC